MNAKHSLNHGQSNTGDGLESKPDVIQKSRKTKSLDFSIKGEGRFCTLYLLRPLTPAAFEWVEEHLPEDRMKFSGAVVVEHRYVADIVRGAMADGLEVR